MEMNFLKLENTEMLGYYHMNLQTELLTLVFTVVIGSYILPVVKHIISVNLSA
jgi:hypothetical protein